MGAGGLGRRALAGLRRHGVEPLAFADNGIERQGTTLDGVPVLSPEAAAREFGRRAVFVVTIWGANRPHRFAHSREQLRALGCDVVCSFPPLFWKYPSRCCRSTFRTCRRGCSTTAPTYAAPSICGKTTRRAPSTSRRCASG